MAACPSCFASLRDDDTVCRRCGRAVAAGAPAEERPTITPWVATGPAAAPSNPSPVPEAPATPSADPAPAPPNPAAGPPVAGPPVAEPWVAPVADPAPPTPGTPWVPPTGPPAASPPWRPPDQSWPPSGSVPPPQAPPHAPPGPPAGPPWAAPPPGWPQPAPGWPDPYPGPPSAGAAQVGREPNPDRSNVIVLIVTAVALGALIVGLALYAQSGEAPELQVPRPVTTQQSVLPPEADGGR